MSNQNPTTLNIVRDRADAELEETLSAAIRHTNDCIPFHDLMTNAFEPETLHNERRSEIDAHITCCFKCASTLYRLTQLVFEPSHWVKVLVSFLRTGCTENRGLVGAWRAAWIDSTPPQPVSTADLAAASAAPNQSLADELQGPTAVRGLNASLLMGKTLDGAGLRLRAKSRQRPIVITVCDSHPPEVLLPTTEIWDTVLEDHREQVVSLPEKYRKDEVLFVAIGLDPDAKIRLEGLTAEDILEMAANDIQTWDSADTSQASHGYVKSIYVLPPSGDALRSAGSP